MVQSQESYLCKKCGEEKTLTTEHWYKHNQTRSGFDTSSCKSCRRQDACDYYKDHTEYKRQYQRKYRVANADSVRERQHNHYIANAEAIGNRSREWRLANAEYLRAYFKRYHAKNVERKRAYRVTHAERLRQISREWRQVNRDKGMSYTHRRRARKLALPDTLTSDQIASAYDYFSNTCAVCRHQLRDLFGEIKPNLDHWIALSDPRPDNPGTAATNMLPLCNKCNLSKSNSDPVEWLSRKFSKRTATQTLSRILAYFEWVAQQAIIGR